MLLEQDELVSQHHIWCHHLPVMHFVQVVTHLGTSTYLTPSMFSITVLNNWKASFHQLSTVRAMGRQTFRRERNDWIAKM